MRACAELLRTRDHQRTQNPQLFHRARTYLGDEGNITPYFLIPVFLVGGAAYFLLPLNLFVVMVIASAASFYAHLFSTRNIT